MSKHNLHRLPVTYADAADLVAKMIAAWPMFWVSPATAEVYCEFVAEFDDLDRARAAIDEAIRSCREWPTIAEIRVNYVLAPPAGPEAEMATWPDREQAREDSEPPDA
jgi:hypothetical protein